MHALIRYKRRISYGSIVACLRRVAMVCCFYPAVALVWQGSLYLPALLMALVILAIVVRGMRECRQALIGAERDFERHHRLPPNFLRNDAYLPPPENADFLLHKHLLQAARVQRSERLRTLPVPPLYVPPDARGLLPFAVLTLLASAAVAATKPGGLRALIPGYEHFDNRRCTVRVQPPAYSGRPEFRLSDGLATVPEHALLHIHVQVPPDLFSVAPPEKILLRGVGADPIALRIEHDTASVVDVPMTMDTRMLAVYADDALLCRYAVAPTIDHPPQAERVAGLHYRVRDDHPHGRKLHVTIAGRAAVYDALNGEAEVALPDDALPGTLLRIEATPEDGAGQSGATLSHTLIVPEPARRTPQAQQLAMMRRHPSAEAADALDRMPWHGIVDAATAGAVSVLLRGGRFEAAQALLYRLEQNAEVGGTQTQADAVRRLGDSLTRALAEGADAATLQRLLADLQAAADTLSDAVARAQSDAGEADAGDASETAVALSIDDLAARIAEHLRAGDTAGANTLLQQLRETAALLQNGGAEEGARRALTAVRALIADQTAAGIRALNPARIAGVTAAHAEALAGPAESALAAAQKAAEHDRSGSDVLAALNRAAAALTSGSRTGRTLDRPGASRAGAAARVSLRNAYAPDRYAAPLKALDAALKQRLSDQTLPADAVRYLKSLLPDETP